MQTPENPNLEEFIDRKLKALPPKAAPANLVTNVMNEIARRAALPWYKQSFAHWPKFYQNLFLVTASTTLAALFWFALPLTAQLSLSSLVSKVEWLAWIPKVFEGLSSAVVIAGKTVSLEWIIGALGALALFYAWCIAAGVALFRVAQRNFSL